MRRFIRGIMHPEAFHGQAGQVPFFEGWYIKLVTADRSRSLALIPGLFRGRPDGSAHAFIQVVRDGEAPVQYASFPPEAFAGASDRFSVQVGESSFGARGVSLKLDGCEGEVSFGELASWPVSAASPGVMGWYAWMPIMQCYHGILSLDHELRGYLEVEGERLDFNGGRGYIEKDWGRSFPVRWVWMQSNHFDEAGLSVTVSIADVPWFGGAFPGFLVGVWRSGSLMRFTTYTGARVEKVTRDDEGATFVVTDKRHRLSVRARGGHPTAIYKPSEADMRGVVHEYLGATLDVHLSTANGDTLYQGTGRQAAFEVEGDISHLRHRSPFARGSHT